MTDVADTTASLIAAIWLRIQPLIEERLATIDQAAAAATAGSLAEELRVEALDVAHKLAGALGMYGYDEGTRVAREIEILLGGSEPDAARLSALIADLRESIFPRS